MASRSEDGGESGANGIVKHAPETPAAEEDPNHGYTAIGPVHGERKIREWALVLQSASVWHATRRTIEGWILLVHDADAAKATRSIDRYEEENRDWPPPRAKDRPAYAQSPFAPAIFAALIAFFLVTGTVAHGSIWFQRGIAISDLVVRRMPWQAITALTLHADAAHVLGNAISGTIFGAAVMRRYGPGGGALAILASGAAGNYANALYHHFAGTGDHGSLGASTAVFGAIGILAAAQVLIDRRLERRQFSWLQVAAPIVGGLALLGSLGAGGANTDLGAHFFGFAGGVVVGLLGAIPMKRRAALQLHARETHVAFAPTRWWIQPLLGAFALSIVIGSWTLALR